MRENNQRVTKQAVTWYTTGQRKRYQPRGAPKRRLLREAKLVDIRSINEAEKNLTENGIP